MANLAIHGVQYLLSEIEIYHYKIEAILKNPSSNIDLNEINNSVDEFEKQFENYRIWKVSIFIRPKYNAILKKIEKRLIQMREMLSCLQ